VDKVSLPVLYSMAEVFVYPSLYEGFGLPVLEAMACGTPVITTHISSLPEVGGEAVLYAHPTTLENDLVQHMITLCQDTKLRQVQTKKGLTQSEAFSWDKAAQKYLTLFDSLNPVNVN
jgi:glycosyltransferase involved in cell wall biosynthesis